MLAGWGGGRAEQEELILILNVTNSAVSRIYITLLSALSLQVSFWPFLGRLLPEVNKVNSGVTTDLVVHPSAHTFPYNP